MTQQLAGGHLHKKNKIRIHQKIYTKILITTVVIKAKTKIMNISITTAINIYINITTQIAKYKTMGKESTAYHYSRKQLSAINTR